MKAQQVFFTHFKNISEGFEYSTKAFILSVDIYIAKGVFLAVNLITYARRKDENPG